MTNSDIQFLSAGMCAACGEARLWLGATSPNPPVGATALDEQGRILAVAAHKRAGTDHAEAALLTLCREQGLLPRVHTLCVTLEPCNHHGRTPPCTEAIIDAGIRRVAIGARDPNPHVKGGGIERLREAGIEIIDNVESLLCQQLIHVFAFHAHTGKPFITVKRAFDENGSMIPPKGQKTFTSHESLVLAHRLRKKADAIMTGSGTILTDNPSFTVRHVEDFVGKKRILAIVDRRHRVTETYLEAARANQFEPILYKEVDACLLDLEKRGVRDILVESGPLLSQFMLDSGHWGLCVDIHKGKPDQVKATPNPSVDFLFNSKILSIDSLLPL